MANILWMGASGRIGHLLRHSFLPSMLENHHMVYLSRNETTKKGWFQWDNTIPITDIKKYMETCGGFDVLINLAGDTPASQNPDYSANVSTVDACFNLANLLNIPHLILFSSASVYSQKPSGIYYETDATKPQGVYGKSKVQMEKFALDRASSHGCSSVTILRIGNVLGADHLMINANKATLSKPLKLHQFQTGHGPLRSYIGPKTLARVLLDLSNKLTARQPMPTIMNVATPGPVYMDDLLRFSNQEIIPNHWEFIPAPENAIEGFELDLTRLSQHVSFEPDDMAAKNMVLQMKAL